MTDEFHDHYNEGRESGRLDAGAGLIEYARTKEIIARFLPKTSCVVYDVGGGPGTYAAWMLDNGHQVHLVDPVAAHIDEAMPLMKGRGDVWTASVGDARELHFPDDSADAVLLLGPLYHLTERDDRVGALREAHRVLRPGGVVFAAAISKYASLFDGMAHGLLDDPAFQSIVERDLAEGQHRNPTAHPAYFTTAYFHEPDGLRAEVADAGFHVERLCGLEGPTWLLPDLNERLADAARFQRWLEFLRTVETEPSILGASAHVLAVARK